MGSVCHGYMCILLYDKLIGVVVFKRSMLNWRLGGQSAMVYVHSLICQTDLV